MISRDDDRDETATRGGYVLPPQPPAGRFAGPAEDPDRYELVGEGMSGGEGTTWRARYHGRLQAPLPLAVKQLRSPPGAPPGWPSERDRRLWQDQAELLRHLRPDHVVRLHEVFLGPPPHEAGAADGATTAYLVMEWVEGPTLRDLYQGLPVSRDDLNDRLSYLEHAAAALTDLFSTTRTAGNPSVHRDLKPGNCIVHPQRGLVLIDISTLRLIGDGFDPVGLHTPQYTAPEALAAVHQPRTPASDAFSLGALAVYCLTGRDPRGSEADRSALEQAARSAEVADPAALTDHVLRMTEPDPARRPDDLMGWARTLRELGRDRRRGRMPIVVASAAVLLVLIVVVGWIQSQGAMPGAGSSPSAVSTSAVSESAIPAGFAGTIRSPAQDAPVRQCSYLDGTATIPKGFTLVLAMRNLTNGDPERFIEFVFGFDDPTSPKAWRGAQYFGQADQTVGQRYEVQLVAVRLDAARALRAAKDGGSGESLAAGGVVLAAVQVRRVAGQGPNACEGP